MVTSVKIIMIVRIATMELTRNSFRKVKQVQHNLKILRSKWGEKVRKCKCGGTFIYDGYDEIEIDERELLCITGECKCNSCGIEGIYKEYHEVNFEKPFDIEIDTNVDGID